MAGSLEALAKYRYECCEEAIVDAQLMYDVFGKTFL